MLVLPLHQLPTMDVRVRLVFADDVGRHVQRRRGFSSCWYLVPKDAKLVGDLAHALLQEFGLRKRCPKGLELRLEELPVLATQSIRIVRDNDTIVVQCPPLERKDVSCSETSSSESEVEDLKQRKRKARVRKKERKEEQPKKKVKTLKDAQKEFKDRQSSNAKSRGKSEAKTLVGAKKSSSSGTGSSSESSSSSSSESSSSSSESEDGSVAQRNRKRVAQVTTTSKQQPDTHKDTATTKTSSTNGVASKTNAASGKSGKEPRRRRRRLRQRSGGRQRNGNQASIAESSASLAPLSGNNDTASQRLEQVAAAPEQSKQASSSGGQNGVSVAGLRGYPHAKTHVLFDEVTGDQVEVERDENRSDIRESRWTAQSSQAPELAKYGPSSSGNQRSRTSRDNHDQFVSSSSGLVNGDDEINDYNDAPKRKGKCKYEERWKRPYKIVATVLGKKPGESSLSTPVCFTLLLDHCRSDG